MSEALTIDEVERCERIRASFRKLSTDQLQRRFRDLERDTSATEVDEECARMFAVQAIADILIERGEYPL